MAQDAHKVLKSLNLTTESIRKPILQPCTGCRKQYWKCLEINKQTKIKQQLPAHCQEWLPPVFFFFFPSLALPPSACQPQPSHAWLPARCAERHVWILMILQTPFFFTLYNNSAVIDTAERLRRIRAQAELPVTRHWVINFSRWWGSFATPNHLSHWEAFRGWSEAPASARGRKPQQRLC